MSARSRRLSASGRVAFAMTLVLAVGVATLCFLAYTTVRASLTAEVDRTLLHEADEYNVAIEGSGDTTSLAAASRRYLRDHTGASAGPDPILLVLRTAASSPTPSSSSSRPPATRRPRSPPVLLRGS